MDLVVRGGTVVTPGGRGRADVGVVDGRVAQIGGQMEAGAAEVDARDLLVLPGGVDMHVHLSPAEVTEQAVFWVDDFESGSRAAAVGGVTTVGNMCFPRIGEPLVDAMRRHEALAGPRSIVDYVLHPVLIDAGPESLAGLPALADRGYGSVKVFMILDSFDRDSGGYLRALAVAESLGMTAMVHCEDGCMVSYLADRLVREGRGSLDHYPESRPVYTEAAAVTRAVAFCRATGVRTYVVHLSSAAALGVVRDARAEGLPVYAETRPLYLYFTEERLSRPDGPLYIGNPPMRSEADRQALWAGLRAGDVETCCTDHAPFNRAQKLDRSRTVASVLAGTPELETLMPLLFSEGVRSGRISLETFVEVTSTNAARLFGLYPRKGAISIGSDADLVVWDPREVRTVRAADAAGNSDYSPYEGWEVTGWPRFTIRRGEVIAAGRKVTGSPGSGRRLECRRPADDLALGPGQAPR